MMPISYSHNIYSINNVNTKTSTGFEFVKLEALLNRKFVLIKVNGSEPTTMLNKAPNIEFKENNKYLMMNAHIDNTINGIVSYEKGVLKQDGLMMSTLMINSDTEMTFINVLQEGANISIQNNQLILKSSSNELIFE